MVAKAACFPRGGTRLVSLLLLPLCRSRSPYAIHQLPLRVEAFWETGREMFCFFRRNGARSISCFKIATWTLMSSSMQVRRSRHIARLRC